MLIFAYTRQMNIMFVYSVDQLSAAATFVCENNKHFSSFSNVVDKIKTTVRLLAKENITMLLRERELKVSTNDWNTFSGTAGFYAIMTLEDLKDDQIILTIDILVDPALGKPKTYISEEFDSALLLA